MGFTAIDFNTLIKHFFFNKKKRTRKIINLKNIY